MEDWRQIPIEDFKDLYQVSDQGRVRSVDTIRIGKNKYGYHKRLYKGKILKNNLTTKGYYQVRLCVIGKQLRVQVHRLVAMAFIPNPDNLPEVDHINTIRTDNRVCNLRWASSKSNANNPITRCNLKTAKITQKKTNKPIIGTNVVTEKESEFESAIEAERVLCIKGLSKHIGSVIKGKRKTAGGYTWRYK